MASLREARAQYFVENGLPPHGGYQRRWVRLQAGRLSLYFPNTKARVRAVRLHDLHHVLTGYETTWCGEAEIGAWEVASGCGRYHAAWLLDLQAMALGLVLCPRRVFRAFIRGRYSGNLYDRTFSEELLDTPVTVMRRALRLDAPLPVGRPYDWLAFAGWSVVAAAAIIAPAAVAVGVVVAGARLLL